MREKKERLATGRLRKPRSLRSFGIDRGERERNLRETQERAGWLGSEQRESRLSPRLTFKRREPRLSLRFRRRK